MTRGLFDSSRDSSPPPEVPFLLRQVHHLGVRLRNKTKLSEERFPTGDREQVAHNAVSKAQADRAPAEPERFQFFDFDSAQVGAPASADSALRSVVASVFNWVLGGFGPAAIAAQGLSLSVMMIVISCLGGGVNQALVPTVGYSFGARNYRRMWRACRIAALWTGIGGLFLSALVCIFAPQILAPFTKEAKLAELGPLALRLRMSTFCLVEPQMMLVFMLQGMGMGGLAMFLTLTRNAILVMPLLLILSAHLGVIEAFAAQPISDILTLFVAAAMLWRIYLQYPPSATTPHALRPGEDAAAALIPTVSRAMPAESAAEVGSGEGSV